MKVALTITLLSVLLVFAAAVPAEQETFTADFVSGSNEVRAREVQSVAVEMAPESATVAQTVSELSSEEEAADEDSDEEAAAMEADEAEATALVQMMDEEEAAEEDSDEADEEDTDEEADEDSEEDAEEDAAEEEAFVEADAETAPVPAPPAPPAPAAAAPAPAAPKPAAAAPPAAPPVPAAPKPAAAAPAPASAPLPPPNPLIKKSGGVPAMAGPALPDVSGKELRESKLKMQRLSRLNRRLRRHIRRLKKRIGRCRKGSCPRKFPIMVGPEGGRVLSTTTRYVKVLGDKERNKKRWSAVDTHPKLMWHPPKLKRAHKFHRAAGRRIAREAKFIKNIGRAPLVERRGKWIIKRNYYEDQNA